MDFTAGKKKRNPHLTLDATAGSAPGWIGNGKFWSQDAANYYVKWLQGLRSKYVLELNAIGCRNEKGVNYEFAKTFRNTLNTSGFKDIKLHAFDNWTPEKLNFIKDMLQDEQLRNSIDIISGHVFNNYIPATNEEKEAAEKMGKPIWNIPILCTPVSGRRFVNGKIENNYNGYSEIIRKIAIEEKIFIY